MSLNLRNSVLNRCVICAGTKAYSIRSRYIEYEFCEDHFSFFDGAWNYFKSNQSNSFNRYPIYQWLLFLILSLLLWITWFAHLPIWTGQNFFYFIFINIGFITVYFSYKQHAEEKSLFEGPSKKGTKSKRNFLLKFVAYLYAFIIGVFIGEVIYSNYHPEKVITHNLSIIILLYMYYRWNKHMVRKEYYELIFSKVILSESMHLHYSYLEHNNARELKEGEYKDPLIYTILSLISSFFFLLLYILNEVFFWRQIYLPGILEIITIWSLMYGINLPKRLFNAQIPNLRHSLATYFTLYAFLFRVLIEILSIGSSGAPIILQLFLIPTEVESISIVAIIIFIVVQILALFMITLFLIVFKYQFRNNSLANSEILSTEEFYDVIDENEKQNFNFGFAILSFPLFLLIIPLMLGMISSVAIIGVITILDLILSKKKKGILRHTFNNLRLPHYFLNIIVWDPLLFILYISWYTHGNTIISNITMNYLMLFSFILLAWPLVVLMFLIFQDKSIESFSFFQVLWTIGVFLLFTLIPAMSLIQVNWIQYILYVNVSGYVLFIAFSRNLVWNKIVNVFKDTQKIKKLEKKIIKFKWEIFAFIPLFLTFFIDYYISNIYFFVLWIILIYSSLVLFFIIKKRFTKSILSDKSIKKKMGQCIYCSNKADIVDIICRNCYINEKSINAKRVKFEYPELHISESIAQQPKKVQQQQKRKIITNKLNLLKKLGGNYSRKGKKKYFEWKKDDKNYEFLIKLIPEDQIQGIFNINDLPERFPIKYIKKCVYFKDKEEWVIRIYLK